MPRLLLPDGERVGVRGRVGAADAKKNLIWPMSFLDRIYRTLIQGCGVLSALLFGVVAVLVTLDVLMRNLGLGNLPWIVEVSEYSLPLATFLSAPWLLHANQHVRVEILVTSVSRQVARLFDQLADLVGLAGSLALVWYGIRIIVDSRSIGSLVIKTLVFPEWWLFVPLPAGAALLAVEFVRRMARRSIGEAS